MTNQKNIDKGNLRQVIIDSPKQFEQGFNLAKKVRPAVGKSKAHLKFSSLVVSGMGGSALPADILKIYLRSLHQKNPRKNPLISISANRFYSLPYEAYENCLNFFASYSGNTEETISSLKEAIRHKLPSVAFTTGGQLEKICKKYEVPCVILPKGIEPRYATGYFFSSMLQVLINSGLAEDQTKELLAESQKLKKNVLKIELKSRKIAKSLIGKVPVVYSSAQFQAVAMIWKIKLNESAKTPAFYNYFPELNHNEMSGFTNPKHKYQIITLLDKNDHPQNIKRMHITAKILKPMGVNTIIVEMEGKNIFETIFSTLLLGDWVSYHLALAYGQDPTPVKMVDDFKKLL